MYARTTTLEAMPSSVDAGIAYVRDKVMPLLEGLDGYIGLSLLADRSSGRCIITSAWESEDAMRASAPAVQEVRSRAAEIFGGGSPTVDEWEIAVLHREHEAGEGACVRVTWAKVNPDQVDAGIEVFKAALPAMQELEGHCSASLLVDRASGRGVVVGGLRKRRRGGAQPGRDGPTQGFGVRGRRRPDRRRARLRVDDRPPTGP